MRMVAEHPEQELIGQFLAYLRTRGIGAEIRARDSAWALWVHNEDSCRDVRREFDAFLENPAADKYAVATIPPDGNVATKDMSSATPLFRSSRLAAGRPGSLRSPVPVTSILLGISIAVSIPVLLSPDLRRLLIYGLGPDGRWVSQWWRLVTPAFLHFTGLHILFNMLWLRELGGRVEGVKGSRFMLLFFLVTAVLSNYAQWIGGHGHPFGGMSGVVYGLFGYVWIKARLFPEAGFSIDSLTVMVMTVWFFMGWTGYAGPIANWAHGFGLVTGMALALLPEMRPKTHPPGTGS